MFVAVKSKLRLVQESISLFLKYESLSLRAPQKSICDRRVCSSAEKIEDITQEDAKFSDLNGSLESRGTDVQNIPEVNYEINSDITDPTGRISLETFAPYTSPTFNFAAYVNKSPTLQELVKLGVDLHIWEKKKGIPNFVLRLDFERDMKHVIRFLHDNGVPADRLGSFISKNPLIFKEKIEDLEVRLNYLESKKFTTEMIAQVITKNPYWLMFSTLRIDSRLGHFQKSFHLNGAEIRELSSKLPRLITYNMNHIKGVTFAVKEIMGFQDVELKSLLLKKPKLWMMNHDDLIARFNYVHNEMGIPHTQLTEHPAVLGSRLHRIQQRHQFLEKYCPKLPDGRSRYDPKNIGYVSLESLVTGNDAEFCSNVAKVSVESFNAFLKSL